MASFDERRTNQSYQSKKNVIGSLLSIGKNLFSFVGTSVKFVQKVISNKIRNLVNIIILLVMSLFFLTSSFVLLIITFYHLIIRYLINDPLIASAILGCLLLIIALILFIMLGKKVEE